MIEGGYLKNMGAFSGGLEKIWNKKQFLLHSPLQLKLWLVPYLARSTKTAMLRRLGLMLLFVLDVKKCFTIGSQKVLAFLWLISFRYGFFRFLALSAITNILHEPRDKSREIPWDNIDSRAWQTLACEQALLFGRVKRVSRERASERRSRERLASLAQIGELARRLGKLLARKQGKLYS